MAKVIGLRRRRRWQRRLAEVDAFRDVNANREPGQAQGEALRTIRVSIRQHRIIVGEEELSGAWDGVHAVSLKTDMSDMFRVSGARFSTLQKGERRVSAEERSHVWSGMP